MDKTIVSVPVEPTEAMLKAAHAAMLSDIPPDGESTYGPTISTHAIYRAYWAAMLSAAPAPQPVQGEAVQIAAPDHIADARKMVAAPGDVEQRALAILAATMGRTPEQMGYAEPDAYVSETDAIHAITAALRSQPVAAPGDVEREVQMLRELLADADHALAELGACDIPDCDEPNCLKVRQRIAAIAP